QAIHVAVIFKINLLGNQSDDRRRRYNATHQQSGLSVKEEALSLAVDSLPSQNIDIFAIYLVFAAKAQAGELSLKLDIFEEIRVALQIKEFDAFQVTNAATTLL